MSGGIRDESAAPVQVRDRVSAALGVPSLEIADDARRYALRQRIAHTEELEVWHAIDRRVGRDIVLKLCTSDQPDACEKFLRETCIQAQLEHPNIVPIYDFGLGADHREFSTAQRVSGITLRSVLDGLVQGDVRLAKKFARDRLLGIFHQLCLVSDFMHTRAWSIET